MKITKQLTLAAIATASLAAASTAHAAIICTYDIRIAGQSGSAAKSLEITSASQVVNLEIYGQVANNDGDHSNDGVGGSSLRVLSNEGVTQLLGDFSASVRASSYTLGSIGTANAALDANPDKEWGTLSGTSNTGNFNPSMIGTNFGSNAGTGTTDILLGTIKWTAPAVLVGGSSTDLTLGYYKIATTGFGSGNITVDGQAFGLSSTLVDDVLAINATPIHLSVAAVPEPASLGVLALGGLVLLARRRK